jgi:hypothetical protein
MAHFNRHCDDCERLLGNRYEGVNLWIDELFATHGPRHRRFRHHAEGIIEARKKFGGEAWKAALIHILRDCGKVPAETDYIVGAEIAPEYLEYDSLTETAREKFDRAVAEWTEKIRLALEVRKVGEDD